MASKKNRKLSGVVLTGALVAPAVMSAAQQNVASADLSSSLKKFGSWVWSGIKEYGKNFLSTRTGKIAAVAVLVGAFYGLFSLGKMGFEYVRNKSLGNKGGAKTIIIDQNNGSKALTDKAGYKQFMENLRGAREYDKEFNMQTSENEDEVTITLEKSGKSLKIVANFKGDNLEKIIFEDKTNLKENISIEDDFANNLVDKVNDFFKYAKIPVLAETGVPSREVADVGKIIFQPTNTKNNEYNNITENDDNEEIAVDDTEVDYNVYRAFIKRLDRAIEDTGTTKAEETKNKEEIITTLNKQEKVLKIRASFKKGKLQKVEVARESKGNEEYYYKVNNEEELLTTMNTFFEDAGVLIKAYKTSTMNVLSSVNNIDFKVNKKENEVVLDENKDNIKKEQIEKAIDESTTKEKIEAHVKNLIENKVKNKQGINPGNIKIEVKEDDVTTIKNGIKPEDYLKDDDFAQNIEKLVIDKVSDKVSDKYGKEVDDKIKIIEKSIEEATKDVALKEQIGNILLEKGFEFDENNRADKENKVAKLLKKVKLVELKENLDINGEANENAVKAAVNEALKQQLKDDIERLAERTLLYSKVYEVIGANTKNNTNSKVGIKRNYIKIKQEDLKKILGGNYNDSLNVEEGINVYLEDSNFLKSTLASPEKSGHHFVLTFDEKNNRYIFKSHLGNVEYVGSNMNELIKNINTAFKAIYKTNNDLIKPMT